MAASGGHQRELGGLAAAVWVVLDEPGTAADVASRLDGAGYSGSIEHETVQSALDQLDGSNLIVTGDPATPGTGN
ncbi:MAG: hypothetical protein M9922_07140 [Microthrixaceae bacterium]|nr:hypothetical protein [Microthrixaceae bacterium]